VPAWSLTSAPTRREDYWDLARRCGLSTDLAQLVARRERLREVAQTVTGTANPVTVEAATVEALLVRALNDEPPQTS
jgi:hypothetical protein